MHTTQQLHCLYYPFSRCLDTTTLKYLCLIFDSVTFIDEVEDITWRQALLRGMRAKDPTFPDFGELSYDYDILSDEDIIKIISPINLNTTQARQVALATRADISDPKFMSIAGNPGRFGLPAPTHNIPALPRPNKPMWQVFQGKIASPLITSHEFMNDPTWLSHIIAPGSKYRNWTFSYEVGSALVTNFYLQAAEALRLTPVTTSQLHHELVLQKLKRVFADSTSR